MLLRPNLRYQLNNPRFRDYTEGFRRGLLHHLQSGSLCFFSIIMKDIYKSFKDACVKLTSIFKRMNLPPILLQAGEKCPLVLVATVQRAHQSIMHKYTALKQRTIQFQVVCCSRFKFREKLIRWIK